MCLINFWNFLTIHVFGVEESIADISTELPRLGDLENPGRLPVQHVLGGTGECVLSIFEMSSLFMFLRSGNPLLTFLLSYHVRATSKIQVTFPFKRFLKLPKHSFFGKNALNLYAIARKDVWWSHDQCFIVNFIVMSRHVTSCHVMSRHFTSWHAMPRHVTSRHVIISCHVMLRDVIWCHVMPRHTTSCHVTSRHVTSRHVTSCHFMTSHIMSRPATHVTSCHVMSPHVTSCHAMSRHFMSHHVTPCHVMSRHVTSWCVQPCHVQPRHVTSCHVRSHLFTSCHVMPRCVTSCHITSCHVVSRHVTSCHVMPRWLPRRVPISYRISGISSSCSYFVHILLISSYTFENFVRSNFEKLLNNINRIYYFDEFDSYIDRKQWAKRRNYWQTSLRDPSTSLIRWSTSLLQVIRKPTTTTSQFHFRILFRNPPWLLRVKYHLVSIYLDRQLELNQAIRCSQQISILAPLHSIQWCISLQHLNMESKFSNSSINSIQISYSWLEIPDILISLVEHDLFFGRYWYPVSWFGSVESSLAWSHSS